MLMELCAGPFSRCLSILVKITNPRPNVLIAPGRMGIVKPTRVGLATSDNFALYARADTAEPAKLAECHRQKLVPKLPKILCQDGGGGEDAEGAEEPRAIIT